MTTPLIYILLKRGLTLLPKCLEQCSNQEKYVILFYVTCISPKSVGGILVFNVKLLHSVFLPVLIETSAGDSALVTTL